MPITMESAVEANAARRDHSTCGINRFIIESLAIRFCSRSARLRSASFISSSRCCFLFQAKKRENAQI